MKMGVDVMTNGVRVSLLCGAMALAGCKSKPVEQAPAPAPKKPAVMDAAARAKAAAAAAAHPAFKIFKQKIDMPVVIVVAEKTTDEQLKNLLWFLRGKVRDDKFKELGLQPTADQFDTPGYSSGRIDVYRGAKCANEVFITSGPDPCGSTVSHRSANYHWGDGGNRHADGGSVIGQDGKDTLVFDAGDGWQSDAEAAKDPDGSVKKLDQARIRYAQEQTAEMLKKQYDTRFYVDEPDDVLNVVSRQFLVEATMNSFLTQFKVLELDHACALHFTGINLIPRGQKGHVYPLDCSAAK